MNDFRKSNPLAETVKGIMVENDRLRAVEAQVNKELGVYSRNAVPSERLDAYDRRLAEAASAKIIINEESLAEISSGYDGLAGRYSRANEKSREKLSGKIGFIYNGKTSPDQDKLIKKLKSRVKYSNLAVKKEFPELADHLKEEPITYAQVMEEIRKNLGEEALEEENFGSAFKAARQSGKTEFDFGGKKFNTMQKGEDKTKWAAEMAAQQLRAKNVQPVTPAVRGAKPVEAPAVVKPVVKTPVNGNPDPLKPTTPGANGNNPMAEPAQPTVAKVNPPAGPMSQNPANDAEAAKKVELQTATNKVAQSRAAALNNTVKSVVGDPRVDTQPAALPVSSSQPPVEPVNTIKTKVDAIVAPVKTDLDASTSKLKDYFKESTNKPTKKYRTMTSLVESIQNKEYLNEAS